ncbi:TRAP transporter small permease subunit [Aurantimonas sp. A2-1-M11]|uniref:TRAP transporter small permease n=1 Tax=Aurantimonas sp. A2-1-M11 TaxID=3113712 RepID=UPI002F95719E
MKRLLNSLDSFEDWTMVCGVAVATILVVTQVVLRYVFNMSIYWAEEAVRYIVVWMAMVGASMGVRKGKHVSIDLLSILAPSCLETNWRRRVRRTIPAGC